ncbi:MAG: hypothetical protein RIG82_00835 [Phycisphaeraceae bacterium]
MQTAALPTRLLLSATLTLGITSLAHAEFESEFNDDFFNAQNVSENTIFGFLGDGGGFFDPVMFGADDFYEIGTLSGFNVDTWAYAGFTPFRDFVVIIDNDPYGFNGEGYASPPASIASDTDGIAGTGFGYGGFGPDTTLGIYDGILIDTDDNSSPLGDGSASAIVGQVNGDGSIFLQVSGYPDGLPGDPTPFDGFFEDQFGFLFDHDQFGDYYMYVVFDQTNPFDALDEFIPAETIGDTDFYRWDRFDPGTLLRAGTLADFDPMLIALDESESLITFEDDFYNLNPIVQFNVPASGEFTLGVTGYPDFSFVGDHPETGSYDLLVFLVGDQNYDDLITPTDIDLIVDNFQNFEDLVSDINLDGITDAADIAALLDLLGTTYGDANLDLVVDLIDLSLLATNFGEEEMGWIDGDFNHDRNVDLIDLSILATNFGFNGIVIPEPASAALLTLSLASLRRRSA